MVQISNRSSFEVQLRRAIIKRDLRAQFCPEYLDELQLPGIDAGALLVEAPLVGRIARHVFAEWLDADLRPLLLKALDDCGEPGRGVKFTVKG